METNINDATIPNKQDKSEKETDGSISNPEEEISEFEESSTKEDRTSIKRPHKSSDKNATFVEKLWEVLNTPEYREAIHWSKDGQSFRIEPKMFYETSLNSKQFQGCKFESFLRRLLRWGFERVILEDEFPINAFVYQHASFKAGQPDLIHQVNPPRGAKNEAKKSSRKKPKKSATTVGPAAASFAPNRASRSITTEESKTSDLNTTQQGIISHLMTTREAIPAGPFSSVPGLDRNGLLHSLRGNTSDPIGLLLQRNHLANIVSNSLSSSVAAERNLLARQLLAQQDEEALLVTLLRNRSQLQSDPHLRSNPLLSNSSAALSLAPSLGLQPGLGFLGQNSAPARGQSETNPSLYLHSFLQGRSPQLSSTAVLEALRRGQLSVGEAEALLRQLPQSDLGPLSRFLPPR